jgi:ubiquinone/menaquinone biosynthesis C-methylase UbiE
LSASLEFTGERFTPECEREIWYEHFHRYAVAAQWCGQKRTLDAACGEGYGAALLAGSAESVEAVDLSEKAITHARQRYADVKGLSFHVADCTSLPFPDHEFDRIVSFETLEHLTEQEQLLAEFRRVLKADGFLILSSPEKAVYTDQQKTENEFHVKELYRDELEELLGRHFPAYNLLGQKLSFHSAIWSLDGVESVTLDHVSEDKLVPTKTISEAPMYLLALCAAEQSCLPDTSGKLWLFDDESESVYQHYHGEIKRNMAAGGIIAGLEKKIAELEKRSDMVATPRASWWQRLLGKS